MRTNIVIDDQLMQEALEATGLPTKRAVVEAALKLIVHLKAEERIRDLRGRIGWEGDLEESRLDCRQLSPAARPRLHDSQDHRLLDRDVLPPAEQADAEALIWELTCRYPPSAGVVRGILRLQEWERDNRKISSDKRR